MSGLFSDVLPAVYSGGNRLRRLLGELLSDPVGVAQQRIGLLNDQAGNLNQLTSQSTDEAIASARAGKGIFPNGPATNKLTQLLADSYNPIAMTVWHGSPHTFSKFDASKIGTGEGAQAYGHGLYLAESPDVAGTYSGKLSSELKYAGRSMKRESGRNTKDSAAWALYLANGDKEVAKMSGLAKPELIDALDPALLKPGGQLYKVDLPDEAIAKMLDWDAPLSKQSPEAQAAINGWAAKNVYGGKVRDSMSVDELLRFMSAGKAGAAESILQEAGVPGIRYLDGGSRGVGSGTSNFVVFPKNEGLLRILERNGQPVGSGLLGQ